MNTKHNLYWRQVLQGTKVMERAFCPQMMTPADALRTEKAHPSQVHVYPQNNNELSQVKEAALAVCCCIRNELKT